MAIANLDGANQGNLSFTTVKLSDEWGMTPNKLNIAGIPSVDSEGITLVCMCNAESDLVAELLR